MAKVAAGRVGRWRVVCGVVFGEVVVGGGGLIAIVGCWMGGRGNLNGGKNCLVVMVDGLIDKEDFQGSSGFVVCASSCLYSYSL